MDIEGEGDPSVADVSAAALQGLSAQWPSSAQPEKREALLRMAQALSEISGMIAAQAEQPDRRACEDGQDEYREGAGDRRPRHPGFRYLEGEAEINHAIQEVLATAHTEILTAQPDGPRPGPVLDDALHAVHDQVAAGISMRTLYQHSTRFDEPTKEYVQSVTQYGVQVRTLAEFFDRMILVDRAAAFIPANADRSRAVLVTETAVVHFLADVFDRAWDRAATFPFLPVRAADAAPEVIPAIRESICKLLIEGRSDKEIARRLGLSLRSLQAHVAWLKKEYGAQHRLQLGYLMGMRKRDTGTLPDGSSAQGGLAATQAAS
ncbi:helix-turn-helix transcriptional regulator [Streptomyces sp. NRRL F-5126]|uniref:helix-turn-helix transcriptional regulator n=1 Tax=Streptomyces sp. NRRL F-5126 TaxID=1463857 RepID=UPI00068FCAFD|nr:helix-turn-helix transcriptional regulator [Streptomyces sp. NRRL F-5126]